MISAAFIVSSLLSSVSFHGRSMCVGEVAQLIIGGDAWGIVASQRTVFLIYWAHAEALK